VIVDTVTESIRGSVIADIEVPAFQFNPVQTAWELVPFSFVVDWFFTVGDSLSALSFAATQKAYSAAAGFSVNVVREYSTYISDEYYGYVSGPGNYQTGHCEATYEHRRPCILPYQPRLTVKLNNLKIIDLLTLVLQRLKH
jgi:hypothetical protein